MEIYNFDSRNTSPLSSAPPSPQALKQYYFSAPTRPLTHRQVSFSFTPLQEEDGMKGFAFNSVGDLPPLSSADELFDGGKIKTTFLTPNKILNTAFSFNNKVCSQPTISHQNSKHFSTTDSTSSSFSWLYKKWSIKNFLFRNASEGHQTNNNKYDFLRIFYKNEELKNTTSVGGKDSYIRVPSVKKKNNRALTAHERHYKVKRAAAEEMRKRTYLPYNQKLMMGGCIDIDAAAVRHPSRPLVTRPR